MTHERAILDAVSGCEGLTATELSILTDLHRSTVQKSLIPLLLEGKLRREFEGSSKRRGAKTAHYYLGDGTPQKVRSWSKKKTSAPTPAGWQARYEEAAAQLADLIQWRSEATRRYPDLAIPDVVIRARAIVAKAAPDHRDDALSGKLDHKPIMQATIAALEEVS